MKHKKNHLNKFSLYLSVIFLIAIAIGHGGMYLLPLFTYLYFGVSGLAFLMYAIDKSKAKRNAWRIPENTLHTLSLLGGWPGAAIGQQLLRHKTQKRSFRIIYWLTVVVNLTVLSWYIYQMEVKF